MSLSAMESVIADELSRTDLTTQIAREITNAITFYQNKRFWFTDNQLYTITTISGQRTYPLPPNFAAILDVRSMLGSFTYKIDPAPGGVQYLDSIDWGNNFISSYIDFFAVYNGQIRLYPPPTAGLPVYIRGTTIQPTLTTTAATKSYAFATAFNTGDTIQDQNGNIQTATINGGTTQTAPTNSYAVNTAFTAGNTVQDGNGNIQTCLTPGTSGYLLFAQPSLWGNSLNSITTDGTTGLTWQLTTLMWSTDYGSFTQDGSQVWQLTNALSNPWMVQAEELIRTRATGRIYRRYIKDLQQALSYEQMEKECLTNLYEKNIGQNVQNTVRPHW
jgi:hypothetical protein